MTAVTGTFFGDFDVDDAYDTEPADPHQVARRLHLIRQRLERLVGRELDDYDDISADERGDLDFIAERIVDWVRTHDADAYEPGDFARQLHEFGRERRGTDDFWDRVAEDHQVLAVAIGRMIAEWLIRQGAWR